MVFDSARTSRHHRGFASHALSFYLKDDYAIALFKDFTYLLSLWCTAPSFEKCHLKIMLLA